MIIQGIVYIKHCHRKQERTEGNIYEIYYDYKSL